MTTALIVLAALVLGGVATELLFRLYFRAWSGVYMWPPYFHFQTEVDPNLSPYLAPRSTFRVNSLGARGEEPPTGGRTYRILATGGSAVECFFIDHDSTWSGVAAGVVGRPESRARLGIDRVYHANIGRSGITAEALACAFPRLLPLHGKQDVVLIMIAASALNYWTRIGTPSELPAPDDPWVDVEWHPQRAWGWSPRRTATAEVARRLLQILRKPIIQKSGVGRGTVRSRGMRKKAKVMRDTTGDPRQLIEYFERTLTAAIEAAQPWSRRVVVVRQPWFAKADPTPEEEASFWHGSVGDPADGPVEEFYSHRVMLQVISWIDEATVRVGQRTGAVVLNPAEVLEPSSRNFYDFFHLTTEGAARLGAYVGEKLLQLEEQDSVTGAGKRSA